MGHITHHKKGHGKGHGNALAEVMAGCTVRARLRLTDGGVALDWTDGRVAFRDIGVWSDARQGVIAHPAYSIDADDPTLLVVEHTTSVSDLPGIHRLIVTVTFMGWTAAHTVAAYVLSNDLVYGGTNPSGRETETELEVRLHDVSTTFLQRLIDQLLALRWGENERITALETLTRTLRSEVDALTERADKAESRLDTAEESIRVLTEGMRTLAEALETAQQDIKSNAEAIAANTESIKSNAEAIAANTESIKSNAEAIAANADAIIANTEAIKANSDAIASNTEDIQANADNIASLEESKQDRLIQGENITITEDNVISAAGTDLSDYYTKEQVDGKLGEIDVDLSDYYTKEEVDDKIADAGVGLEKLTDGDIDEIWDGIENEQ